MTQLLSKSSLCFEGVILGTDHAGFHLKEQLKSYLQQNDIQIEDVGCFSEASVDYPNYGTLVAEALQKKQNYMGLLCCGSGIGVSIAANRYSHVRAALCYDNHLAYLARQHNNANVLCMGARFTAESYAKQILETFLTTPFDAGHHSKRVEQLAHLLPV